MSGGKVGEGLIIVNILVGKSTSGSRRRMTVNIFIETYYQEKVDQGPQEKMYVREGRRRSGTGT